MKKTTMIKATIGIMAITSLSKLTGFFREVMIAYRFGSDFGTDAYFITNTIYAVIFGFAGAGLGAAIIPVLSRIRDEGRTTEGEYIGNITRFFALASLVLIALSYVLARPLVKVFAVGFTGAQLDTAVSYLRIGLPVIFCNFMYSIYEAFSHSKNRFYMVASGGIVMNAVVVLYLVFFHEQFGIPGLIFSNILAYGLRAIYIYIPLHGFRGRLFETVKRDEYLRATYNIMVPIMVSSIISYINLAIDRTLASTLVEGSISSLKYASQVRTSVNGLLITSMVTVIYPSFSEWIVKGDRDKLKKMFTYAVSMITILVIPITVGLMTLNREIIDVVYSRGAFNAEDARMTSSALFYYSIGMAGTGMGMFINKVYYAYHDSKTTMKTGMAAVALNIVLNLVLVRYMAHNGLALATSIVALFNTSLKFWLLRKKNLEIEYKRILSIILKSLASSAAMAATVRFIAAHAVDIRSGESMVRLLKLLATAGAGALVYFLLIYFLYLKDTNLMKNAQEKIRKRIKI
ncbi:murein biosynthesis integral membrane protein MurJ [Dethiosulfatibacter aminovorans]|nr:murein biosynthesis integral membrane protein MurJ [Dethiosulfatibacter aminovorans]